MQENIEIFITKATKVHGDLYDYSKSVYNKSSTPLIIICEEHGEFLQRPNDHIQGQGCKKCGIIKFNNKRTYTTEIFKEKAVKKHGNIYDYTNTKYINSQTKVNIICSEHGVFSQLPTKHLIGRGCPKCGGTELMVFGDFIKRCGKYHGGKKYKYIKEDYKNSSSMLTITCPIHGEFNQLASNHVRGQGCPKCRYDNNGIKFRKPQNQFIEESKIVHGDLYDYNNVIYKGAHVKVKIKCRRHGEFEQSPRKHLNGNGCPKCVNSVSKMETEFLDYLDIKTRQYFICPYSVDGYDSKTNTIYEFLGDYWHGNPDKFKMDMINEICKKTYGELNKETFDRLNALKLRGYDVKYIWESEWKKFKNGEVKKLNLKQL